MIDREWYMDEELSTEEFLDKKRDYSPFLVHLTRDYTDEVVSICIPAKEVLEQILDEKTLRAVNYKYCYFGPNLESRSSSLQNKFKVVCFTETPLDQIDVLLNKVSGRNFEPKPYGLVFEKKYIRGKGGDHYTSHFIYRFAPKEKSKYLRKYVNY
jgi:hypothetical protein